MLKIVRIHCHYFDISLRAEQIAELLSVRYAKGDGGQWVKETLECIRAMKNVSWEHNPAPNVVYFKCTKLIYVTC